VVNLVIHSSNKKLQFCCFLIEELGIMIGVICSNKEAFEFSPPTSTFEVGINFTNFYYSHWSSILYDEVHQDQVA